MGVYRARNAQYVRRLADEALALGWRSAWWALDEVVDDLAELTVGDGPGAKLPLLNQALGHVEREDGWLLIADDDIEFARGDLGRLVELCDRAGFGLAQPAHARRSHASHAFTRAARLSTARLTTFVESGPLVVVHPRWRPRVTPFPAERGMGWGIELDWRLLRPEGCLLGVVDAVRINHVGRVAADYDRHAEGLRLRAELDALGVLKFNELHRALATWRPWQRQPPWRRDVT